MKFRASLTQYIYYDRPCRKACIRMLTPIHQVWLVGSFELAFLTTIECQKSVARMWLRTKWWGMCDLMWLVYSTSYTHSYAATYS